ncbi:MAG: 30S ribosomal protein S16 [Ignavibacteriales bacterium]|nr:30S ribosomal protein S16 [Ignavibacteriales bacterium]
MVKLRLRRIGKKKQPIYKIVAADSRTARSGKFIESIGQYNPLLNPIGIEVNEARLFTWLKRGAQPTDTLRSLLKRKGLWLKWNLTKKGADEATITTELEKWAMLQTEKLARETERKARRKAALKKKRKATDAVPAATPAPAAAPAAETPAT